MLLNLNEELKSWKTNNWFTFHLFVIFFRIQVDTVPTSLCLCAGDKWKLINKQTKKEDCGVREWADEERLKHVTHSELSRRRNRRSRRGYLPACLHALTAAEEWEAGGEEARQRRVSHCFSRRWGKKQQVRAEPKDETETDGGELLFKRHTCLFHEEKLSEPLHTLPDTLWESLTGAVSYFEMSQTLCNKSTTVIKIFFNLFRVILLKQLRPDLFIWHGHLPRYDLLTQTKTI